MNGQTADLLSVTAGNGATVAPAAGAGETPDPKNGLSIYNSGTALDLSSITVTLNAGENHLKDYKVVVLLSTSDLTNEGNEPTWDFEYTYSITYPTSTREVVLTEPMPGAIPMTALTEQSYGINIQSKIRAEFPEKFSDDTDAGAASFMQSWTGKWYITDPDGNKQPLAQGNGTEGSWSDGGKSYNGWSLANNELSCSSTNNTNGWFFNQQVGNLTVYAPSGKTLGDYLGYRVVFEVSDENPSVEPKVRFVLPIPTGVIFEYDGTPTNTAITQTLDSRTDLNTVVLDWTGQKTSPAITATGYKYARFYVVDATTGTPVSPTDNAHKLTVNGGTLCTNPESGYYVYGGGSNITLPTVTLTSTGDVRDYSVVCWLATTTDHINATGNDVAEEPDIDVSYTYSFVKPALTETVDKRGDIAWATTMQADASEGAPTDWGTSWDELSREQRVVWYVTDGSTKQALALGTAAQANTWVLNLPTDKFSVSSNEAVLTGQTTFTATEWDTWGKPVLYAPSGMTYFDARAYNVVCEVYETAAGTTPNVCYTFTFTKDFPGELKSGVAETVRRVVLDAITTDSYTLGSTTTETSDDDGAISIPTTAKYVRFCLVDGEGAVVDPSGKLTVTGTGVQAVTATGYTNYGYYLYNNEGNIAAPTVMLAPGSATLNSYRVVMVTSNDAAILDGTTVINEPDYDTQTAWAFKYPASHTEKTGEVEWSPVSMTVPLDIDTHKGSGYLASLGTDYHVVWTVSVGGTETTPATGTARQAGTWTYSVDGNNATFYAPTGQTFADMSNVTFVARLYETATGENDADKSLTYTVSIVRTHFLGEAKDGAPAEVHYIVENIESGATSVEVPLNNATTAFSALGKTAKYARVWVTHNGTPIDPTTVFPLADATRFTQDATYGYYLHNSSAISLNAATLTASELNTYEVHIALSVDEPASTSSYARADAPFRAESLTEYEPDYDYLYTIGFSYTGGIVEHLYKTWNVGQITLDDVATLLQTHLPELTSSSTSGFIRWSILDASSNPILVKSDRYTTNGNNWSFTGSGTNIFGPYQQSDQTSFSISGNQISNYWNAFTKIIVYTPYGSTFADYPGYTVVCEVSDVNEPSDSQIKVRYIFHFTEDGNPPYPLLNETAIAATKQMVNVKTLDAAAPVFDMTDALVANAKYARFYLMKRGSVNAASENLTVTYNVNPATACESPYSRFGHYLSEAGGIDPANLVVSTNGISANDMLQYQLVVVSSANELTGTQEPAWQKMTVISFQKDIKSRIFGNDTNTSITNDDLAIGANSLQADVLSRLGTTVADISGSLYAKWYVLAPDGTTLQTVAGRNGNYGGNSTWGFNLDGNGNGQWSDINNAYTLYTGMNANVTSQTIAQNLWNSQIARATAIYVPRPGNEEMHTLDYPGYQIVFELSDEYDMSTGGTDPGYKLRYIWTITDPSDFEGNKNTGGAEAEVTQTVNRTAESINLTLQGAPATTTWALDHEKLRGSENHPRYARFYLTDLDGNPVDPTGKLTVTYGHANGTVTTCSTPEHGFYIFGTNGEALDKPEIHVSLAAPKEYMLYKVVCLFSNELEGIIPEELTLPLQREPDYDLKYTYSFAYNVETAQFNRTIDWMDYNPMDVMADLPNNDPDQDWNISWEELSASQYVSWYVATVDMMGNLRQRQPVAIGNGRQDGTWTLDLRGLPFEVVNNNTVVATGQTTVSENSWHRWGQPDLYAPTGMTYNQALFYRLICEVAATADATPYARYTFGFLNNILGELKATGGTGEEIIHVEEEDTEVTVPLEHALEAYHKEHPGAKVVYVRTWLTTNDGALVSPTSLTWSQMYNGSNQVVPFSYHTTFDWGDYGYYFGSFDVGEHHVGVTELEDGKLTLEAGTHPRYQVHVALSTDNPNPDPDNPTVITWNGTNNRWEFSNDQNVYGWWTQPEAHEPNYDYVYTFKFRTAFEATNINSPELKTKYKTLIYDPASNSCTPTILHNWPEVVADVTSNRTEFAQKAYVRWYLVDKATNEPIEMLDFEAQAPYVSLDNEYGYYFRNFNADNLPYRNNQHHEYDPTITLPVDKNYDEVRVVCVVTTLTDDIAEAPDVLTKEPRQMQVKYIYDLMTEAELAAQPFIHYHGIHYPLYHRSFEDSREFIGPGQPQDLPDEGTAAADLIQRVWDYGKNAIYDPADNSYAAGRTYYKSHNGPQVDPNDAASLLANSPDYTTRNIRQKVHTKEYNYYLLLQPGQQETLKLPFQEYLGGGNDTEPMGYIRWYDWKTDKNHSCLVPHGGTDSQLTQLMSTEAGGNQVDRGWYKIMTNANPTVNNIGIDFKAPDNFNSDDYEEITIACDVSRYMDGLDDSKRYLVHEPTLSIRYVYHILPAKRVADQMVAGATKFNSVISTLEGLQPGQTMTFADIPDYDKTFHLMEYNGRTVVSVMGSGDATKPAQGNFSLRTSLTEIDHYYVYVDDVLKPCNNLQWYAYYEYEGKLYRRKIPMVKGSTAGNAWTDAVSTISEQKYGTEYHRDDARLAIFETKDFWGEYERVRDPNEKMEFHIQPGQFLHLVACLGYDDGAGNITEVPTVSTEFFIVDAAPKPLGSEGIERTDYTLSSQYKKAAELNFDDFFDDPATRYNKPKTSFDNYAKIPMLFADAQYGFCYPRLYGQCATDWHLLTSNAWDGFGFAPLHGDYTLLKSMNMPGISTTRGVGDEVNTALNSQSMYALWYEHGPLYDVTHERASQKATDDTKDYGSFLYVDAAEQARTIGRLEFDAQLCAGAEIYFTAYIADMTDAVRYGTSIPNTTPQVRFRVYTYNTDTGYPVGTVVDGYTTKLLPDYESSATMPVISFLTGDIATEGATDKAKWYQVYGYSNLPPEDRTFLEGDSRHYYVEVDNYCENTYGADYAVDQITFYTNSARVRIAQASDVCDDEKGVKLRITALASALLPHFGQGQDREIFYRIYPYSDDPNKVGLEADEAIIGQNVYCHENPVEDGDRGNLYGAVPFHAAYNDAYASDYDHAHTVFESLDALLDYYKEKGEPEYKPRYGFYKDGDEVYYLLDERYFELKAGQEYFVSLYTLGSYKPGSLEGWGNPYGNHTCTAYSNLIMPRNMYIQLTEANEPSDGIVDFSCSRTSADKEFGVRVRYPLESGGYQDYTDLEFDFFLGTKSEINECYLTETVDGEEVPVMRTITDDQGVEQQVPVMLKDALAHFRGLKTTVDGEEVYKYAAAYTAVPESYASEDGQGGLFYQVLKKYVEELKLLRLDFNSKFINHFEVGAPLNEGIHVYYLALPVYPKIDEDKEICSPITMDFFLDPSGGAPLLELGFDDVKYPADYTKRGVRLGLEQLAKMRDEGYMLHIPISNYHEKNHEKRQEAEPDRTPNTLYFENAVLKLSGTNDPEYLDAEGNLKEAAYQLIVTEIQAPGADGSSNENDNGEGVYVNNNRMYLPLSFAQDSEHPENYVKFKEGYWYEVNTRYYDAGDVTEYSGNVAAYCYADLFIVFKVVPEFATWEAQPIGSTHLYNVSWHNDGNWKRSVRSDLYKDANSETATQNTPTDGHPNGYDNDGEGTLDMLTGDLYDANPNPGFVPMKFTYVTLLTGNHAPSLINEARTTTGDVQRGGYLIDPNQTELMTDTSPVDNKESSSATNNIRYDMVVRYGPHNEGGEGCFGHRSKKKVDGKWGWVDDDRTPEQMSQFNNDPNRHAFDVEKFYGNICKEIYFKPEAELLRQQRLTYEKAWVEKELVANRWYLVSSPLKSTYAGDMYVPVRMSDVSMETPAMKAGRQMTEAFQPISFSTEAVSANRSGKVTSQPAYSRTKYPVYQRSWKNAGSKVWTKVDDLRANNYSANLLYSNEIKTFLEWSHTYNDVQVPYSTATTYGDGNTISQVSVPMGFSIRAHRKDQKVGGTDVPALLRLPKADATYQYFDWTNTGSNPAGGQQTVSKPDAQLTNTINGTTWNYTQPMQHRFITDDASKESSTQGAMEFNISDLQEQDEQDEQDGYVLVGNPAVSSLNMGEFFNGNDGLMHTATGENTMRYSYWTYEGGQAKAYLLDRKTTTHTVTVDGNTTQEQVITYTISSDGSDPVGIIRPMQAFFVKKGSADKIYFTRNMGIDGNWPVNNATSGSGSGSSSGNGEGSEGGSGTDGGARPFGVTLKSASATGGSSATVWMNYDANDDFCADEDVETLFDSNLADVPMVYTVAGGQAVSIDQRPSLALVPFGVTTAQSTVVPVTITTHHSSLITPPSSLHLVDALTGELTEVADGDVLQVQSNDYGRYFLMAAATTAVEQTPQRAIVISVRDRQATVTATEALRSVSVVNAAGQSIIALKPKAAKCTFSLTPGVYIVSAVTAHGRQQLKVIVR